MRNSIPLLAGLLAACTSPAPRFLVDQDSYGPYSSGVVVGDLVLLSGKIGAVRGGSFEAEVESCIDAIEVDLEGVGLGLQDVVETRVYLTDIARYPDLNGVYAARFQPPYPARTCVAVQGLPAGARVEIQVVARHR